MSTIRKLSGRVAWGSVRHTHNFEVCTYARIGNDYLSYVKVPGHLATLLRDGVEATVWVAMLKIPMPWLFSSKAWVVYAAKVDGKIYNFADETRQEWGKAKFWQGSALTVATIVTVLFPPLSLLLLINAIRLTFTNLPVDEMRREPANG